MNKIINRVENVDRGAFVSENFRHQFWRKTFSAESVCTLMFGVESRLRPDPEYFFIVTLYGRELTPISRRLRPELIAPLTERQRKILDVMNEKGSITSSEVTRQWGITRETAATDFHKLIELGLVERKGIGRSTYYVLRPM